MDYEYLFEILLIGYAEITMRAVVLSKNTGCSRMRKDRK